MGKYLPSYMTLQLLHSEFTYIEENFIFFFIGVAGNLDKPVIVPLWDRMEGAWLWTRAVFQANNNS
jgi:hypothetical protein